MMRRNTAAMTLGALSTVFVIACSSEGPTTLRRDLSANAGLSPNAASMPRYAEGEYLEVCKDYVLQPGTTAPTATDFSLSGPGVPANTTFSLAAGECRDVFSIGGINGKYTVTETVPDGYTAEVKKDTVTAGVYALGSFVDGASITVELGGVGGSGGTGALVIFQNTEEVNEGGCSLTQGYWKTHSSYGPAPSDAGWNLLPGGLGPNTVFYSSSKTWYQLFWTPPAGGNVYIQLAHQYMAAKLNVLNGATPTLAVSQAITAAETFFGSGATPTTSLTNTQKNALRALAATLGSFNEGDIGPGHCGDQTTT